VDWGGQFQDLLQHLSVGSPEAPGLHEQTGVLPATLHRAPTPQTPGSSHNDKFSSFSNLKNFLSSDSPSDIRIS